MSKPTELKVPIKIPQLPCGSVKEFIPYLNKHQDTPVTNILEPFKAFESELRKVYAQQPDHEIAKDGHINMVPIFAGHEESLKIRARPLGSETDEEKSKFIMTLKDEDRKPNGAPAIVSTFKDFQNNFNLFSESSLADLDWNNVVAAGSAVTTSLLPVPLKWAANKRSLREYYHEHFAIASDVDLFLYGLNEEQALEKIKQIEQSIKNSILYEVTTVRTKHAISIISQYPTRHVQIVLRLYDSISQIITGFDVDCSCAAFDGKQVYAAPRAIGAFITQCNTIDLTRRSPSYENRLSKYSHRGFEVHWPLLDRTRVDPTIFERSFGRTQGLARLLILEKLPKTEDRDRYLDQRRAERGRPQAYRSYRNPHSSNIKEREEDEVADWAVDEQEVASYHTMTVPYGQKYHAGKINRLLYAKDILLNAEWNQPKDREVYLHRHPCFFGTAAEVIEDCCGHCPVPKTDEEIEVAEEESKIYISGKLKFIVDDPGRQSIGSFNPITDDEWTTMAYVGDTARLCQAIVDGDLEHVQDWCAQEGVDVNRRDYTGRTPLHLATMTSTPEIVQCLVDHGARLTARLVDGRTALHIAAARGNADMVKTLMNKSLENEEEEEEAKETRRLARKTKPEIAVEKTEGLEGEGDDEDDDLSSEPSEVTLESEEDEDRLTMGSFIKVDTDKKTQEDVVLEDSTEEPDIYDVDVVAWDHGLSPLHLAILNGHTHIIELLASEYGADVLLPVKLMDPGSSNARGAIMTIVLAMTLPKDKGREVVKTLVQLGANSAQADMDRFTIFHYAVKNNSDILDVLLAEDRPVTLSVLNSVAARKYDNQSWTPLASAVQNGNEDMVAKLLKLGAKPTLTFEDWVKTYLSKNSWAKNQAPEQVQNIYRANVTQPIMNAAVKLMTKSIRDLLAHGVDPQTINSMGYNAIQNPTASYYNGESLFDVINNKIDALQAYHSSEDYKPKKPEELKSETSYVHDLEPGTYQYWTAICDYQTKKKENDKSWKDWSEKSKSCENGVAEKKAAIFAVIQELEVVKNELIKLGAKSFYDQYPHVTKSTQKILSHRIPEPAPYSTSLNFTIPDLNEIKKDGYIKLFNAAWNNDSETIERLTLSPWSWKPNTELESPLRIAVQDYNGFSPFSIAILRGHEGLARKIIQISMTQYHKDDGISSRERWQMSTGDDDDEDCSDDESDKNNDALPIFSELINDKFTIDNLGEVATLVKSDILPLTMIEWTCRPERFIDSSNALGSPDSDQPRSSLFEHAVETDNNALLRFLIEVSNEQQARLAEEEDETCYTINHSVLWKAIRLGRTSMLTEMIKTTGAGISLNQLVKSSGVELTKKPKYYQGLSVGGKKREDWAQAPGQHLRAVEEKIPPLLQAASFGSIDSVEWFMSDAPLRRYKEFAESNKNDKRLKTLEESGKSFESTVGSWLALKSDLVLHCAILYRPTNESETHKHLKLIQHLISIAPKDLEQKSYEGWTPLHLAVSTHRPDIVSSLISAGASTRARDNTQRNIVHLMLVQDHGAVQTDAKKLETMLELFDKTDLGSMFTERCDQHPSALTPLAFWMARNYGKYNKTNIIDVLTKYSTCKELEMINGEGDLPLHVAIKQTLSTVTERLISLNPSLLYRENATGRTPLEMSRDIYLASCVENSGAEQVQYYYNYQTEVGIIDKPAIEFIKTVPTPPEESKKRTFEICAAVDAEIDSGSKKRRLVSLFEANEVAKRVGGSVSRIRWGGNQIVVNGVVVNDGLTENGKKDVVGEWFVRTLREVQAAL